MVFFSEEEYNEIIMFVLLSATFIVSCGNINDISTQKEVETAQKLIEQLSTSSKPDAAFEALPEDQKRLVAKYTVPVQLEVKQLAESKQKIMPQGTCSFERYLNTWKSRLNTSAFTIYHDLIWCSNSRAVYRVDKAKGYQTHAPFLRFDKWITDKTIGLNTSYTRVYTGATFYLGASGWNGGEFQGTLLTILRP